MTTKVFAPAKINLALHVVGQRADGYHLLDSLVAFAPVGDTLRISEGDQLTLAVSGAESDGVPQDSSNLVMKAAGLLARGRGAAIQLEKNLPAAAGIGGGSADAAAAIRGLLCHWQCSDMAKATDEQLRPLAADLLKLGADIPMCLACYPARVRGIGEDIEYLSQLKPVPALLVNPRVAVRTPDVFAALAQKENPPLPDDIPVFETTTGLINWLGQQRNDLEAAAQIVEPTVGKVLAALKGTEDCFLARMSGSGATCFALFPNQHSMIAAKQKIRRDHPAWWVSHGMFGDQSQKAMPKFS